MTLREKRCLFTLTKARLIVWICVQGWEVASGEGYVALTDAADGDYDGPHKKGGAHYTGLAEDLLLYVNGEYIADGNHPAWHAIATKWESMHPLARSGLFFTTRDANHISFEHEGRS